MTGFVDAYRIHVYPFLAHMPVILLHFSEVVQPRLTFHRQLHRQNRAAGETELFMNSAFPLLVHHAANGTRFGLVCAPHVRAIAIVAQYHGVCVIVVYFG